MQQDKKLTDFVGRGDADLARVWLPVLCLELRPALLEEEGLESIRSLNSCNDTIVKISVIKNGSITLALYIFDIVSHVCTLRGPKHKLQLRVFIVHTLVESMIDAAWVLQIFAISPVKS